MFLLQRLWKNTLLSRMRKKSAVLFIQACVRGWITRLSATHKKCCIVKIQVCFGFIFSLSLCTHLTSQMFIKIKTSYLSILILFMPFLFQLCFFRFNIPSCAYFVLRRDGGEISYILKQERHLY